MGQYLALLTMGDKEVEVNGKTIGENSKITLKASTLMWIIGGLVSVITTLATVGYFDIKSDVKSIESDAEREKLEYKEEIRELLQEELKDERDKREKISEDIGEIKGDIKVILEKTRNLENNGGHGSHPINTGGPDTTSRPNPHH